MRIAWATAGSGYPLVNAAHWLGHLEFDWRTPVWRPWFDRLSRTYRLIRYDTRGCGLSDRAVASFTLPDLVSDLECVVDAAGLERFALLGMSQGGAVSIAYAAKHPQRVSHLVLCGAFARGELHRNPDTKRRATVDALIELIEHGWGHADSPFLQLFTSLFFPRATPEQSRAFNEIQHRAATPEHAARIFRALIHLDATEHLLKVACPTLVLHSRSDAVSPFEEGRFLAASIAGARFEPLDSANHLPLDGEPAFERAFELLTSFLPDVPGTSTAFPTLSPRERQVLALVARGLDNAQIGAHLDLAEKTVRNHVTRIFDKISVETRAQAIVRAREAGLDR